MAKYMLRFKREFIRNGTVFDSMEFYAEVDPGKKASLFNAKDKQIGFDWIAGDQAALLRLTLINTQSKDTAEIRARDIIKNVDLDGVPKGDTEIKVTVEAI